MESTAVFRSKAEILYIDCKNEKADHFVEKNLVGKNVCICDLGSEKSSSNTHCDYIVGRATKSGMVVKEI